MALDLDGVDDEVNHGDIAAFDGTATFSCMCWVNIDDMTGVYVPFIAKIVSATPYCFVFGTRVSLASTVFVAIGAAGSNYGETASGTRIDGVTEHWAFTYDGGGAANADRLKIYKDGIAQSLTYTGTIPATSSDAGTDPVRVGRNQRDATFADGRIAFVKAWSVALTAAEIAQEAHSYRPIRTAGLLIWAPYDDGTSARDYSGNGNHGTITGALQFQGPPVSYGG